MAELSNLRAERIINKAVPLTFVGTPLTVLTDIINFLQPAFIVNMVHVMLEFISVLMTSFLLGTVT